MWQIKLGSYVVLVTLHGRFQLKWSKTSGIDDTRYNILCNFVLSLRIQISNEVTWNMDEHQMKLRWNMDGWMDGCVVSTSSPTWHNGVPNVVPLHVPMWRPSGKGTWWVMGPLPRLPSQALPLFLLIPCIFQTLLIQMEEKKIFLLCVPRIWILSGLLTSSTGPMWLGLGRNMCNFHVF